MPICGSASLLRHGGGAVRVFGGGMEAASLLLRLGCFRKKSGAHKDSDGRSPVNTKILMLLLAYSMVSVAQGDPSLEEQQRELLLQQEQLRQQQAEAEQALQQQQEQLWLQQQQLERLQWEQSRLQGQWYGPPVIWAPSYRNPTAPGAAPPQSMGWRSAPSFGWQTDGPGIGWRTDGPQFGWRTEGPGIGWRTDGPQFGWRQDGASHRRR